MKFEFPKALNPKYWSKKDAWKQEVEGEEKEESMSKDGAKGKIWQAVKALALRFTTKEDEMKLKFLTLIKIMKEATDSGKILRTRSIVYRYPKIFKNTKAVTYLLQEIAKVIGDSPSSFNIHPCEKGEIAGPIEIWMNVENHVSQIVPKIKDVKVSYIKTLIPDDTLISKVKFTADIRWVVVFEKESVFNERLQELNKLYQSGKDNGGKGFGLILNGRGYANHAVIKHLRRIRDQLPPSVPFYMFGDADIHGIQIFRKYNSPLSYENSSNFKYRNMLKWIGMDPSKWQHYIKDENNKIYLKPSEVNMGRNLLECHDLDEDAIEAVKTILDLGFGMSSDIANKDLFEQLLP